jgi:uncharacterized membrane protein
MELLESSQQIKIKKSKSFLPSLIIIKFYGDIISKQSIKRKVELSLQLFSEIGRIFILFNSQSNG